MSTIEMKIDRPIELRRLDIGKRTKTRLIVTLGPTTSGSQHSESNLGGSCRSLRSEKVKGPVPNYEAFKAKFKVDPSLIQPNYGTHMHCEESLDDSSNFSHIAVSEPQRPSRREPEVFFTIRRERWGKQETIAVAAIPASKLVQSPGSSMCVFFDPREFSHNPKCLQRVMSLAQKCSCQCSKCKTCGIWSKYSVGITSVATAVNQRNTAVSHCSDASTNDMFSCHI